jgi:hypothetical protein
VRVVPVAAGFSVLGRTLAPPLAHSASQAPDIAATELSFVVSI